MARGFSAGAAVWSCFFVASLTSASPVKEDPAAALVSLIKKETGVKGGLVVHVRCTDGRLEAAFAEAGPYIVEGLALDSASATEAREFLADKGLSGKVSVKELSLKDPTGAYKLPYISGLVNLLVVENVGVSESEIFRVLAPRGAVFEKKGDKWSKRAKAVPRDLDSWPLYLHDPQGTMVSKDRVVGPPRRAQWIAGPKWLRNHDFMSSLNGLVAAGGRIFAVIDLGLRNHIYLPSRWYVVARDAFNGTFLWKRRINDWWPQTWPFKSGPAFLPRRIAATDHRVYVTLGLRAPVSVLDAATGKTLRVYNQTKHAEEIVLCDGVLYLVVDARKLPVPYKHASADRGKERDRANLEFGWSSSNPPEYVMAVDSATGNVLWKRKYRVAPLTLAVGKKRVYFFDGEHVVALDRRNGATLWVSQRVGTWTQPATGYAPRLIVADSVVVISTRQGLNGRRLVGLSAENGRILWCAEQVRSGHFSPEDLFLVNGVLWTAETGRAQNRGTHYVGIDVKTGAVRYDFTAKQLPVRFMHQRCYPGRATIRYLMTSGTGTEFLPLGTKRCLVHHWVRGSCIYGVMPANGLLYKPPDTCACFYESKLPHFCALAPAGRRGRIGSKALSYRRGPAFGAIRTEKIAERGAWPTYRCDNKRSGFTPASVALPLKELWKVDIGGRLSALTAAGGKVFFSSIDSNALYAVDAACGKILWRRIFPSRVDSPPTVCGEALLAGCADGWVYCLRASDGKLAWCYRVAPAEDRLVAYERIESVWPLHGSVLVEEGIAYCLAGRNRFLDGGLRLALLKCRTGELVRSLTLGDRDPKTGKNLQALMSWKGLPVANSDILSCDGTYIYMREQRFDLQGNPLDIRPKPAKEWKQAGKGRHLFCPTGFLDDWWFHRSYWIYGLHAGEGHGQYPVPRRVTPTGRIMVFDTERVYGFFPHNVGNNINPRTHYSIYAARKDAVAPGRGRKGIEWLWHIDRPPLLANAMVGARETLFLAGPPDVADEEKTFDYVFGVRDELNRALERQEKAWLGAEGGILLAVHTREGKVLGKWKLRHVPVWDGMIAAYGKLYIALKDGTVVCMGSRR